MIRPITIVTFLMACGSGLYLYQSKHEVQLLDRTIEKTVHDTGTLREQSRLLSAEWTMLNDPDRLRQFSDTYLRLKSINPAQFTSLNDLDGKLPAPRIETPATSAEEIPVVAETAPPTVDKSASAVVNKPAPAAVDELAPAAVADTEILPVPPIPMVRPVQVATLPTRPIESKGAIARSPVVADPKPAEPRASEQRVGDVKPALRVAEIHPEARPVVVAPAPPKPIVLAAPRPQPMYAQPVAAPAPAPFRAPPPAFAAPAPAPYTGSLLGMAHGSMPPAPRPTPVNATYNAN
jgi:hypothetical protein